MQGGHARTGARGPFKGRHVDDVAFFIGQHLTAPPNRVFTSDLDEYTNNGVSVVA